MQCQGNINCFPQGKPEPCPDYLKFQRIFFSFFVSGWMKQQKNWKGFHPDQDPRLCLKVWVLYQLEMPCRCLSKNLFWLLMHCFLQLFCLFLSEPGLDFICQERSFLRVEGCLKRKIRMHGASFPPFIVFPPLPPTLTIPLAIAPGFSPD